jgi:hypothetical protein
MTDRVQVDQLQPGTTFHLIVDWRIDGTDELVPAADTLTAFDVTPNGTMIEIQTEVGTLVLDEEDFVVVISEGS